MVRGTLTARVHAHMDEDAAAREVLVRGALSLRAMARWLIRAHGWTDATEEAVVSALRRYPSTPRASALTHARRLVGRGHVNVRGNVCRVTAAREPDVHRSLGRVMDQVDASRGDIFRVIDGAHGVTVVAGKDRVPDVRAHVRRAAIRSERADLVECDLVLPAHTRDAAGALALVCSTLAARGVSVVEASTCGSELLFLVPETDAQRAFQALVRLTTHSTVGSRR